MDYKVILELLISEYMRYTCSTPWDNELLALKDLAEHINSSDLDWKYQVIETGKQIEELERDIRNLEEEIWDIEDGIRSLKWDIDPIKSKKTSYKIISLIQSVNDWKSIEQIKSDYLI